MTDFQEICIRSIDIFTVAGDVVANASVFFRSIDGKGPEIRIDLSVDADNGMTLEELRKALAEKAILLLREAAALPDQSVDARLHAGALSTDDR